MIKRKIMNKRYKQTKKKRSTSTIRLINWVKMIEYGIELYLTIILFDEQDVIAPPFKQYNI